MGGEDVIVDPGTYVYASDPVWRNRFRSTAYHNTVTFCGAEQRELPCSTQGLFRLMNSGTVNCTTWSCGATGDLFRGRHVIRLGKARSVATTHERTVVYDKVARRWTIQDMLQQPAECGPEPQLTLHVAPWIGVIYRDNVVVLKTPTHQVSIHSRPGVRLELADIWYSSQYGFKHRTRAIRYAVLRSITIDVTAQRVDCIADLPDI